jgi:hypothetical protein
MARVSVKAVPATGFWRCGMYFEREAKTVDVDAKTLSRLKAEPMLVVEDVPTEIERKK